MKIPPQKMGDRKMKFVTREVLINDDYSKVDAKTENEFYKLLTKNNNLLQLWHQLIIEKSKKNDTKGESKEEEIQQD